MDSRDTDSPRIAVLADDLTSAGDGAAPFRAAGHQARILLSVPADTQHTAAGVTAVDLGSRLLDEADAAARTRAAARTFAGAGLLLKTMDSTLRGHVAAEIRAARAGAQRHTVVIAPAFPAEGRTTVGGVQFVRGVPVDTSEFARDPVHPVRCADLSVMLPEAVLTDAHRADELPRLVRRGGLIVCSAEQDGDLDRLVGAIARPEEVLWVGSPGLAAALARRYAHPAAAPPAVPAPARRPLVVAGSAHPATRRQLALLAGEPHVHGVTIGEDPAQAVASLRHASPSDVLTLRLPDERCAPDTARALGRSAAAAARTLVDEGRVDALVVTGGETAATVLHALGGGGIALVDEPEPGVARGTLLDRPGTSVLIKAGGFGDDRTLLRLCRILTRPDGDLSYAGPRGGRA